MGYQRGETSFVSIFEYSFLFFVTLWAYLAFSEQISGMVFLGMLLILFSGVLLSFSESNAWLRKIKRYELVWPVGKRR